MKQDPKARRKTAIAKGLHISQPSVTAWVAGTSRPEGPLRDALEILTSGFVPAKEWLLAKERESLANVKPLTGT